MSRLGLTEEGDREMEHGEYGSWHGRWGVTWATSDPDSSLPPARSLEGRQEMNQAAAHVGRTEGRRDWERSGGVRAADP
ncbi:hypothetical protein PR202_ga28065 [Eleusine coracana subsp. coracana]|uniref:Uncharacterized protein n=1 Tax=Eleusine coracana subsp. coracana TaxID=191504 RepID=A0AAV5DHM7_ELECO|nr:hypothetical protein PR202_ga28065 [Eleusine coracana subsp. coracana]